MAALPAFDPAPLQHLVGICGGARWDERLGGLRRATAAPSFAGRQALQRHCIELMIDRLRNGAPRKLGEAELRVAALAAEAVRLHQHLPAAAKTRLEALFAGSLAGDGCLTAPFHLLRTAALQRSRGFDVAFTGLEAQTPFDLLISRDGIAAEVACDVISAEEGRGVQRGAWFRLVDRIDPDLQSWLRAHPGRYILKLTFPSGLKDDGLLGALHARITQLLARSARTDGDEAVMLRLDPLMLAAAQADELGLMPRLRREFGPEAHLAVTTAGGGIFVLAARAGLENEVAAVIRRRLEAIVPNRLSGQRPGILAMFVEDTDALEWRLLRERLELEGAARQFLTAPQARSVVAVTCSSRLELFGLPEPGAAPGGELRFRNPAHPAAKTPALAPAVLSSI